MRSGFGDPRLPLGAAILGEMATWMVGGGLTAPSRSASAVSWALSLPTSPSLSFSMSPSSIESSLLIDAKAVATLGARAPERGEGPADPVSGSVLSGLRRL